ncbi:MAG: SGNH/GDSL hydrolase family protein [Afipia sp.]|nr:SGNH/GDSL hydrolase family protein [Afipia sp.]
MLRRNFVSRRSPCVAAFCAALIVSALHVVPAAAEDLTSNVAPAATDDLDAVFASQPCKLTKSLTQFDAPMARLSKRINSHEPVTIIAIGSSSTAGAGASSAAFSYPSRLARELKRRFPLESFAVLNLGKNGEEASQMMVRLDVALTRDPDLVIWQVGTNAILRDSSVDEVSAAVEAGVQRVKANGTDILLLDPQFSPAVNSKSETHSMIGAIGAIAKRAHIPLFRRYVAMQHWHDDQSLSFEHFIRPDGIHLNDWGYACLARTLADNIATAVARSRAVADVKSSIQ